MVTIIHFHVLSEGVQSYTRMENYVATLPRKNRGKVEIKKINLKDWDDPTAKKYNITSAPQFWYYSRSGKLSAKLKDRFTAEDIDGAFQEAWRK